MKTDDKFPTIPSKIRIGYRDYKVMVVESSVLDRNPDLARIAHLKGEIYIGPHDNKFEFVDSVIHEILHGIFTTQVIEDGDNQERTVETLSKGLTGVFRDNPKLLKFFMDALK
ncbi:hypothetical protein LCGC14_1899790 [marine sediment metagenome]|uniref:Uncharacterized protein n=1 Tax=marine sediment metagenome TaxID=412755 RepID=A0A0F9FX69_9ZZZZ